MVYSRPLKIAFSVQSLAATSHCARYLWYQRASCWMGLSRVLGSQWDHFCSFKPCLVPSFCGVWHCHQACLFGFWAANGLSLTGTLLYSGAWFSAASAVLLQVCLSFPSFKIFLMFPVLSSMRVYMPWNSGRERGISLLHFMGSLFLYL